MKIKRLFFAGLIVYMFYGFLGLKMANAGEINPIKELITWTTEQNVGITALCSTKTKDWNAGYYWNFVKSEHDWLYSGIVVKQENQLIDKIGVNIAFNAGKVIEKIKGKPLVYLKHLEAGYYKVWDINGEKGDSGLFINVIKIEF